VAKLNPVKVKQDADKLEKAGKFEQAIDLYRQLVEDNPRDWNTVKKIGDLYARLNKNREAIEQYSRVADFYARDGFLLKAIAIWKQINKLDASALDPYVHLADLYAKQGLTMEAKGHYQIVVDEYIKRGKMRDAGDVLKKMAEIDPGDLKVRSKLADLYTRDGNAGKAVDEHVAIADELTKKGHLAEALQVLEKGLKIDPKSTRLRSELAQIHLVQKNWDKATQFLEDAARQQPQDAALLARLGEAYLGAKRVEEAEAVFKRLLELDPGDLEARVHMARVYLLQGALDRAFEELQPAVDTLLERREGERAAALLQQLLQADPQHVESLLKLVEVHRQLQKDVFVAQTYSHLTEAYINRGQMDRAAEILEILISMEPQNQQHKTKLQFVRSRLQGGRAAPVPAAAASVRPALQELEEEDFDLSTVDEAPAFIAPDEPPAAASVRSGAAPASGLARPAIEPSGPLSDDDREFIEEHLAEGRVFRKYGLVDKAADQFEAVVARFSDNADARLELRDVYKEKGLALKAAEQCLAVAEIYRLRGDTAAAAEQEAEAAQLAPDSFPATQAAPSPAVPAASAASVAPAAKAGPGSKTAAPPAPPLVEPEEEEIALPAGDEEVPFEVEEEGVEPQAEAAADLDLELGEAGEGELAPQFLEEEPAAPEESLDLSLAEEPVPRRGPPPGPKAPVAEEPLDLGLDKKPAAPVAVPLRAAPARASARAEAPAAPSVPPDLQRVLAEVDSYISLGFVEDAKEALREIGDKHPAHPAILEKLAELGLEREEALEPAPPPPPPRAARPAAVPVEEELDLGFAEEGPPSLPATEIAAEQLAAPEAPPFEEALDLGLPEPAPPPARPEAPLESLADLAQPPAEEPFPALELPEPALVVGPENGGLDLGSELGELFSAHAAVEEPAAPAASTSLGDSGLEEIFKEFKKGVDKQLGQEDYDTRYNLGIAYKEMGLIDEAIAEFQLAAKDEARLLECSSMLGICFLEKGMPKLAVKWFEKGLKAPGRTEEEYQGLRYDLAAAHEAGGDLDRAYQIFSELYGQDANFRDVAAKVRELKAVLG
jgi:tetratricopeptide (TPR) repeat protein